MKLKLQSIDNQISRVSSNFAMKFIETAEEVIHKRLSDTLQIAFAGALMMLISSAFVHVFFPDMGTGWLDLMVKLGGIAALLLVLFFAFYITIRAGQAIDFSEEFLPKSALRALELPPSTLDAAPYVVIYQMPDESGESFSLRAQAAIAKQSHAIIVGFRDPLVVIKAGDESINAMRGAFPFEIDGGGNCFNEGYSEYVEYVRAFVDGFKRHMRACMASSAEFTLEDMYKSMLPGRIPSNFRQRFVVQSVSMLIAALLSVQVAGQSLSEILGRRASEVPQRGQAVSYVVDNGRTLTYIADGVRNYVQLFADNQGGLSRKVRNFQMVIAGDEVVAKSSAVGQTSQATRVGASTDAQQPVKQLTPRVDVRPDAGFGVNVDPVATTQAIDEFKKESETLFGDVWTVVRSVLRAFGQFILFLMVLLRMFASQAANEMVSTYLGRIWGGSFILSALMTLSAFQMFMAWLAGGYLLCEWAIFLAASNLSTLLWFILLVAGSIVIIKLSKWFVISPRDVIDGSKAVAGGGRGMMVRD